MHRAPRSGGAWLHHAATGVGAQEFGRAPRRPSFFGALFGVDRRFVGHAARGRMHYARSRCVRGMCRVAVSCAALAGRSPCHTEILAWSRRPPSDAGYASRIALCTPCSYSTRNTLPCAAALRSPSASTVPARPSRTTTRWAGTASRPSPTPRRIRRSASLPRPWIDTAHCGTTHHTPAPRRRILHGTRYTVHGRLYAVRRGACIYSEEGRHARAPGTGMARARAGRSRCRFQGTMHNVGLCIPGGPRSLWRGTQAVGTHRDLRPFSHQSRAVQCAPTLLIRARGRCPVNVKVDVNPAVLVRATEIPPPIPVLGDRCAGVRGAATNLPGAGCGARRVSTVSSR